MNYQDMTLNRIFLDVVNSILSLDDLENDNTVNKKMLLKAIDDLREELKDYIKNDLSI